MAEGTGGAGGKADGGHRRFAAGHPIDILRREIRSEMTVWQRIAEKPVCVKYMAVRDANGEYFSTVETVQDFTEAEKHFKETKQNGDD